MPRPFPKPHPSRHVGPRLRLRLRGRRPGPTSHGEPGPVPGGRRRGRQAPGVGRVRCLPVRRLHEGHCHPCHRHRHGPGPADVHSEEAEVPLPVERPGGRGRRLLGQLRGDPRGDPEVQRPLALPGDGEAPCRHGHRSTHVGESQPGARDLGPESSRTQHPAPRTRGRV